MDHKQKCEREIKKFVEKGYLKTCLIWVSAQVAETRPKDDS